MPHYKGSYVGTQKAQQRAQIYINSFKFRAVCKAWKSFQQQILGQSVQMMMDNTVATVEPDLPPLSGNDQAGTGELDI